MRRVLLFASIFGSLLGLFFRLTWADSKTGREETVPKEVRDLAGVYKGEWTLYGIDAKGEVTRRAAWTDTLKAENPQVKGDRAFVTTLDEMTFTGVNAPPRKFPGSEGYFLKKEGGLGDYFIEGAGQVTHMVKLSENVWTYSTPAAPQELTSLGFPAGAAGQHVLVKVVTREKGMEAHRISRVTTVHWKDKEDKERWLQYVSLQGFHQRQP